MSAAIHSEPYDPHQRLGDIRVPASPAPTAPAAAFDSATHEMISIPPTEIKRWDIYKWNGEYRTVSSVIGQATGAVAVYFRSENGSLVRPADIPEDVLAVTVWRPRKRPETYV